MGVRDECKKEFLPLSEKLIILTCTMVRWALICERDSNVIKKQGTTRFEGDEAEGS